MTNEEYLRTLPIKTMAKWLSDGRIDIAFDFCTSKPECMGELNKITDAMCEECALEWLRKERTCSED